VTGALPSAVAIGDLDGDDVADLAVANLYSPDAVSVMLGVGDGTFGAKTDYTTEPYLQSVAIGDVTGDGRPDLAVAGWGAAPDFAGLVSVLPGEGGGAFGAREDYRLPPYPASSVALGDLNGDQKPDMVVAYYASFSAPMADPGFVSVYLNTRPVAPMPTRVELFSAVPTVEGVRVVWRLSDPGAIRSLELDRGTSEKGPWSNVQRAPLLPGELAEVLDRLAPAGETSWYRLSGVQGDGSRVTLGLTSAMAQEAVAAFALAPLSPNPSGGRSLVTFAVPARAPVRLTLVDVQGRQVAVLADGIREVGRYTAALDARALGAGIYFVRLQAPGVSLTRRLALVR
jgi:hypothetical protein